MKHLLLFSLLIFLLDVHGQSDSRSVVSIDTLQLLRQANALGFYPAKERKYFRIYTDSVNDGWIVETTKWRYVTHGPCKRINNCTKITTKNIVIDKQGKVKSKTKEKQLYGHYE